MKTNGKRILSLLLAVVMVAGMVPVSLANAASTALENAFIPEATTEFINNDFETQDTTGITFDPKNDKNFAGIKADNSYLSLEKNAAANPVVSKDLTDVVKSAYTVVEVALASTNLSGAALTLTGAESAQLVIEIGADGKIAGSDKVLAADGAFVTLTVAVDGVANTYSVWVDGEQVVNAAAATVGTLTAMEIAITGDKTDAANLMVDDLKVYGYEPVFYFNDFSETDAGFTYKKPGSGSSMINLSGLLPAEDETNILGEDVLYIRSHSNNSDVAYWNKDGAVKLPSQFVISFDHTAMTKWAKWGLHLVDESGNKFRLLYNTGNGDLKKYQRVDGKDVMAEGGSLKVSAADAANWYPLNIVVDTVAKTWTLQTLNYAGTEIATYGPYNLPADTVKYVVFDSRGDDPDLIAKPDSANGQLIVDNFAVYAGTEVRESIDATAIPAAAETYFVADFETAGDSGLTLTPKSADNKINRVAGNNYIYLNHISGSEYAEAVVDISALDSHYVVVDVEVATSKGFSPLYMTASDGTNETIPLFRVNNNTGELMINSVGMSDPIKLPTDGRFSRLYVVIDTESDVFTLWYGGAPCQWKSTKLTINSLNGDIDFGKLTSIKFDARWGANTDNKIDNLKIYSYDPAAEEATEAPTDAADVTYADINFDEDNGGLSINDDTKSYPDSGNVAVRENGAIKMQRFEGRPRIIWNYNNTIAAKQAVYSFDLKMEKATVVVDGVEKQQYPRFTMSVYNGEKDENGKEVYVDIFRVDEGNTSIKGLNAEGKYTDYGWIGDEFVNDFVHIDVAFDIEANTYTVYKNHKVWVTRAMPEGKMPALGALTLAVPGGSTGAAYIDNLYIYGGTTPRCLDDAKTYLDINFDDKDSGYTLGGKDPDGIHEVRGEENKYVYLARPKEAGDDPKYDSTFFANTGTDDQQYIDISFDIASSSLAATHVKLSTNAGSWYLFTVFGPGDKVQQPGDIKSDGKIIEGISLPGTGEFINVAAQINIKNGTYSLWFNGTKVVFNKEISAVAGITSITAIGVQHTGKGGNVMVDNIKVGTFEPKAEYTVTWDINGKQTTQVYQEGEMPGYNGIPAKAPNGAIGYIFTGWDKELAPVTGDVTYTAQFAETTASYTVTWDVNGVKTTETYDYNVMPEYKGVTEWTDEIGTHTITGWTPERNPVTANVTYVAVIESTFVEHTVTWIVDGVVAATTDVEHGNLPEYPDGTPVKAADDKYTYTFAGWDVNGDEVADDLTEVTGDVTYTAVFEKAAKQLTVTWVVDGAETVQTYQPGETPDFGRKPVKDDDKVNAKVYEFIGWDANDDGEVDKIVPATENVTYKAIFKSYKRNNGIKATNMTLLVEDLVCVHYTFSVNSKYSEEYLKANAGILVWVENDIEDDTQYVYGSHSYQKVGLKLNGNVYELSADGVPAKQLGDTIKARGYIINSEGEYEYTSLMDFNAVSYAKYALQYAGYEDVRLLMVAMMNYGAAAQVYFDYKTDELMNAWMTEDEKAMTSYADDQDQEREPQTTKFNQEVDITLGSLNQSVLLLDNIYINYAFTLNSSVVNNAEELKLMYWDEKREAEVSELTPENASGASNLTKNGSLHEGMISGIAPKDLGDTYYICVYAKYKDGSEHFSRIYRFSVHYYSDYVINYFDSVQYADLITLCKAIINYSYEANVALYKNK